MANRQIEPPGTHVVRQGEDIVSIAWAYGFSDWEHVWDQDQNEAARDAHESPKVLQPGTKLFIPAIRVKTERLAVDQRHRIVIRVPKVELVLKLECVTGEAAANTPYVLEYVADQRSNVIEGNTNEQGIVREVLQVAARRAKLSLPDLELAFELDLRGLDPVEDKATGKPVVSGAKARLRNLGFACGPDGEELDEMTRASVAAFQEQVLGREEPTGELDAETRRRLVEEHGA